MRPPRLLIVTHAFAPSSGTSGRRPTRLARYLARLGTPPVVVTSDPRLYNGPITEGDDLRRRLRVYEVSAPGSDSSVPRWSAGKLRLIAGYRRAIRQALADGAEPDLLLFRGEPFWYFPFARGISRRWGIPYALDMGDLWHLGCVPYRGRGGLMRGLVEAPLERWSVGGAGLVALTTPEQTALYRRRYPRRDPGRFVTVRWGYDAEALSQVTAADKPSDLLRLVIFGGFAYYSSVDAEALARAVALTTGEVEVVHLGHPEPALGAAFRREGVRQCLRAEGVLPYADGLAVVASADCCVANPRSPLSVPVKVYDYIALNRPILSFSPPDCALARFLGRFPGAFSVEDAQGAARVLGRVRTGKVSVLEEGLDPAPYSQERQFDALLERLTLLSRPSLRAGHGLV